MSRTSSPATAQIAFICAMPMEIEPLIRKLGLDESTAGDVTAAPRVPGRALRGGHRHRDGDRAGVSRHHPPARRGAGRSGGGRGHHRAVENETPIGTLVLPEVVVDSATGDEFRPAPLGEGTPAGAMWTTDHLTTDLDEIARLRARGVVSLDMETAAIAALCERRGIPWSVFRVISDRATDGSVDEEVFRLSNMDGTPNNEAIERYFAEHPERVEAMAKLAEGALLGAETAAVAAIRACTPV